MIGFRNSDKILLCLNTGNQNAVLIAAKSFPELWEKEREIKKAHSARASGDRILTNAASPSSWPCFPNPRPAYLLVRSGK